MTIHSVGNGFMKYIVVVKVAVPARELVDRIKVVEEILLMVILVDSLLLVNSGPGQFVNAIKLMN